MGLTFKENGGLIVKIDGSLDSLNAQDVYSALEEKLKDFEGDIVFDFGDLDYISSAGLQVLLMAAKKVGQKGFSAYVSKPKEMVDEVLKISGFYSFLKKKD